MPQGGGRASVLALALPELLSQRVRRPLCLLIARDGSARAQALARLPSYGEAYPNNPTYLGRGIRRRQTQRVGPSDVAAAGEPGGAPGATFAWCVDVVPWS
jgi:hypothetical protein